jgi:hypothetical protein
MFGNQASQLPPEWPEPGGGHVRQPEREEDGVEPYWRVPAEHIGDLEPDAGGRNSAARDVDRFGGGVDHGASQASRPGAALRLLLRTRLSVGPTRTVAPQFAQQVRDMSERPEGMT